MHIDVLLVVTREAEGLSCWQPNICIGKLAIISWDNGLSTGRHQAIFLTNVGILLTEPLGINLIEILIKIYLFASKKMHLKKSSGQLRRFCLGLHVLIYT